MVLFYASWCYHCKVFMPIYEEIANSFEDLSVDFYKGDSELYPSYIETFGLEGFPTILLFVNQKPIEYKGKRTFEDVKSWIKSNI